MTLKIFEVLKSGGSGLRSSEGISEEMKKKVRKINREVSICIGTITCCLLRSHYLKRESVAPGHQMVSSFLALLLIHPLLLIFFSYICSSRAAAPVGDEVL